MTTTKHPPIIDEALDVLGDRNIWFEQGGGFTCTEIESLAILASYFGRDDVATTMICGHARSDSEDEGDDHFGHTCHLCTDMTNDEGTT